MPLIDRLHHVLTPRLAGVINLMLVSYGVFAPILSMVITESLAISMIPLLVLLTILGASVVGKHLWQAHTGKAGYIATGTTADYRHTGFLLTDGLHVATTLCAWMSLGALALYVMIVIPTT